LSTTPTILEGRIQAVIMIPKKGGNMPHVQVTLVEGRSTDQKRKMAARLTDVLVEEAGAKREFVSVSFIDVRKDDFAEGGVLVIDQKR